MAPNQGLADQRVPDQLCKGGGLPDPRPDLVHGVFVQVFPIGFRNFCLDLVHRRDVAHFKEDLGESGKLSGVCAIVNRPEIL